MSALIFTIAQNGYDKIWARCIDSQRRYAEKIGAKYVVVKEPRVIRVPALSAWLKVPLMKEGLNAGHEWVAYIDADCEIKADAPDFREAIDVVADSSVYMANGRSGRLNSGVMFARSTSTSHKFYQRVLDSVTEEIPETARAGLKYENGNIIYCAEGFEGLSVLDQRWNNSVDPDLADYVRHYTGPLRNLYELTPSVKWYSTFMKKVVARPTRQPERRDADFKAKLGELAQKVTRSHREFQAEKYSNRAPE